MHKVNPHTKLCFGIVVLCLLNIVTVVALSSNVANADSTSSASSTASITVPEACTMTSINNAPHTATLSPNTYSGASGSEYANGIGKTTLTATCNDDNGFAIYAIGYTGNSYDSENHNKLVGQSTNVAINTAVYTSGDTTSSWSMKVNKINDSTVSYNPQNMSILDSFDSWHIVPATYTKVAEYHASTGSSTTDTTLGAKVETTYAAYIASNQPADTYIGQVKYTMVHPYAEQPIGPQVAASGCINYFPNGGNVEGTMGCQTVSSSATSTTLLASNYSRSGYGFAGWSDKFDYATNNDARFYGPQEDITFTAGQYTGANLGLSLYAVWVKSEGSFQDSSKVAQVCNRLTQSGPIATKTLNSVSALTDQRDNETYAIAKLADGNCWMIENLRLEAENTRNPRDIALSQGYGTSSTYGNFIGLPEAESTNFSTATANSLYISDDTLSHYNASTGTLEDISTTNLPGYRFPRYNNLNTPSDTSKRPQNPTSNTFNRDNNTAGMYSYGNYYTWHAAIADTTYYDSEDHGTTSLCPTGWRLPIGNESPVNYSFGNLSVSLGGPEGGKAATSSTTPDGISMSKLFRRYPNNFIFSGYYYSSTAQYRGDYGWYFSSTAKNYAYSYGFDFNNANVLPNDNYVSKPSGCSIRCIAAPNS